MNNKGTKWIIQENVGGENSTSAILMRACEQNNIFMQPVTIRPFSDDLLEVEKQTNVPFVLYGRTTMMLSAIKDEYWKKGLFFDLDLFKPSVYVEQLGNDMLNSDGKVFTVKELRNLNWEGKQFIRSNDDLKVVSGELLSYVDFIEWTDSFAEDISEPLNLNTELFVSSPKEINFEYRLVVVEGKIITGCQVTPNVNSFLPPEIVEFGEKIAKKWTPSPVVVLDITEYNGEFKVIEFNCFNGSGFYACDLNKILHTVSQYQIAHYKP